MRESELEALLHEMSISEKIGQLVQWDMHQLHSTEGAITGPDTGKLSNDAVSYFSSVLNFKDPEEATEIQNKYLEANEHKIPLIFMMDVIHGYKTIFPIPLGLSCSFDPELVEKCSRMAAVEASAGGVHMTFTPMVDHSRDPRWGRVMESCGEDPMLAGILGAAQVRGFGNDSLSRKDSLATCVKHFAGYGAPEGGRDYNQAELSEHILREWYLPAYKDCINAGVSMVMPSFNSLNGVPSVANKWLIRQVLRKEWGFDGGIISDYNALDELVSHGIAEDRKTAAALAFENECDMDMVSGCYSEYLEELINDGRFDEKTLDESVMRILKLKNDLGLFEDPLRGASEAKMRQVCLTKENRDLARKAAEESAVLLKNNGVLPLARKQKSIALIGPFAATCDIIGAWQCCGDPKDTVTVEQGIRNICPDTEVTVVKGCSACIGDHDTDRFEEAIRAAEKASAVVLCVGEKMEYSGEGRSRASIDLPGMQAELIRQIVKANPNTVVVLFNGRPLDLSKIDPFVPAILEMWMPGTEGGNAAADLLFGIEEPGGRLTMSFPQCIGQVPMHYARTTTGRDKKKSEGEYEPYVSNYMDCGNLPLYSFGSGLTYTGFQYESLEPERKELSSGEDLNVFVTLRNIGSRAGTEVIQLYVRDLVSSVVTPIQKLAAFTRVRLEPGEKKTVKLTVSSERMKLWNADGQHVLEPGWFEIAAGYADHLVCKKTFHVS